MTRDSFTTTRGWLWGLERAGDGPPVLALHGVGGGSYFFRGLAERMGLRYQVIATDLPTHSSPDEEGQPASMASWAEGVQEFIETHIQEPVAIVGHSLGTILALEVFRRCPERIRGLVFVGGLPEVRELMVTRLRERVASIAATGMAGWGPGVSPGVFGKRAQETRPEVVGLFERLLEAHDPRTYIRNMNILMASSAVDVVPTVDVPCLSVSGTEDLYAPPEYVTAFLARLPQPCQQVLLPGVGHMPFFEVPDEFAGVVGTFLDQLPPLSAAHTRTK